MLSDSLNYLTSRPSLKTKIVTYVLIWDMKTLVSEVLVAS